MCINFINPTRSFGKRFDYIAIYWLKSVKRNFVLSEAFLTEINFTPLCRIQYSETRLTSSLYLDYVEHLSDQDCFSRTKSHDHWKQRNWKIGRPTSAVTFQRPIEIVAGLFKFGHAPLLFLAEDIVQYGWFDF